MLLSKAIFKRKIQFDTIISLYLKKEMGIDSRPAVKFSELLNLYLVGDGINCPSIGGIADTAFTSPVSFSNLINEQISSSSRALIRIIVV